MKKTILGQRKNSVIPLLFILFIPLSWATFVFGSVYRSLTIVLATLFITFSKGKIRFDGKSLDLLLIWVIYVAYSIVTLVWSVDFGRALNNSLGMALVFVLVLVFANRDANLISSKYYDIAWIAIGLICALFFMFGSRDTAGATGSRDTLMVLGNKTDPNEFAGTFLITISLSVHLILTSNKLWIRLLNIVLVFLELVVILSTGSRGALISSIVAVVVTFALFFKPTVKRTAEVFLFGIVGVAVISVLILPNLSEDVARRFTLENIFSDGGSGRSSIWESGFAAYEQGGVLRLLFGSGYGGIMAHSIYGSTVTMHNQFIQILVNYGIVGLILYIALLMKSFWLIAKNNKKYVGAFIGMMVLSMTLSLPPSYKPFWVLLTMAFITDCNISKKHSLKANVKKTD